MRTFPGANRKQQGWLGHKELLLTFSIRLFVFFVISWYWWQPPGEVYFFPKLLCHNRATATPISTAIGISSVCRTINVRQIKVRN
jgi:hypothetical protein